MRDISCKNGRQCSIHFLACPLESKQENSYIIIGILVSPDFNVAFSKVQFRIVLLPTGICSELSNSKTRRTLLHNTGNPVLASLKLGWMRHWLLKKCCLLVHLQFPIPSAPPGKNECCSVKWKAIFLFVTRCCCIHVKHQGLWSSNQQQATSKHLLGSCFSEHHACFIFQKKQVRWVCVRLGRKSCGWHAVCRSVSFWVVCCSWMHQTSLRVLRSSQHQVLIRTKSCWVKRQWLQNYKSISGCSQGSTSLTRTRHQWLDDRCQGHVSHVPVACWTF